MRHFDHIDMLRTAAALLTGFVLMSSPALALEIPGLPGPSSNEPSTNEPAGSEPTANEPTANEPTEPAPYTPPAGNTNPTVNINGVYVPINTVIEALNASGVQAVPGVVNTGGTTVEIAGQNIPISTLTNSLNSAGIDIGPINGGGPTVDIGGYPASINMIASSLSATGLDLSEIDTTGPSLSIAGQPIPLSTISSSLGAMGINAGNIQTSGGTVNIGGEDIPISAIASSLNAAGVKLGDINTGGPTVNIGGHEVPISTITSGLNAAGVNLGNPTGGGPTINIGGQPIPISAITTGLNAVGITSLNNGLTGPIVNIPGFGNVPLDSVSKSLSAAGLPGFTGETPPAACADTQNFSLYDSYKVDYNSIIACIRAGRDPPVAWRASEGKGRGHSGAGTFAVTLTGGCGPGKICQSKAGGSGPMPMGVAPPSAPKPGINLPPISMPVNGTIPAMPCGGAVPLNLASIISSGMNIGSNIKLGNVTGAINGGMSLIKSILSPCGGSSGILNLIQGAVNLVLPAASGAMNIINGNAIPPSGSMLVLPLGMTIDMGNGSGPMVFPDGATFLDAGGITITIPPGENVSVSNGTLTLGSGGTFTVPGAGISVSPGLNGQPGGIILPDGITVPVDTSAQAVSPVAAP